MKDKIGFVAVAMGFFIGTPAFAKTTNVHGDQDIQIDVSLNKVMQPQVSHVLLSVTQHNQNAPLLVQSAHKPPSLALSSNLINSTPATQHHEDKNVLRHLTAVASNTVSNFKQSGLASWYGEQYHGHKTASGETFNMNAMTAAHQTLQMGSYVKVTNKDNGKSVVVKINDRSAKADKSVLDLSYAAAKKIGMAHQTLGKVIIEKVSAP